MVGKIEREREGRESDIDILHGERRRKEVRRAQVQRTQLCAGGPGER